MPSKPPVSEVEAVQRGLKPLTRPYFPGEEWMLANVVADMERGQIVYAIVSEDGFPAIWRTRNGMKLKPEPIPSRY